MEGESTRAVPARARDDSALNEPCELRECSNEETARPHMRLARTRRLCVVAAAVLLAVAAALQTASFVTRSIDADNVASFGGVGVIVVETMLDSSGVEVAVPEQSASLVESGTHSRIVRVRNTQGHPVFVRVSLSATGTDAQGVESSADDLVDYDYADGSWTERDGWHYYDGVLEPGQTTPALITAVSFDVQEASERYQGGDLRLDIDAVAVQSEHNAENALQAEGWPQEGGR